VLYKQNGTAKKETGREEGGIKEAEEVKPRIRLGIPPT
jgi:hypothetical protein